MRPGRRARQVSALGTAGVAALLLGAALQGVSEPPAAGPPGLDPTRVLVLFGNGGLPADLPSFAAAHGARVAERWPALGGALLVAGEPAAGAALLEAVRARGDVAAAQADFLARVQGSPDDPRAAEQWALGSVRLPDAWAGGFGSRGVRVAILDTGADLWHEDLRANVCASRNFVDPPRSAMDDSGHGTHTAGIAGAVSNNQLGIAGASQACLLVAKICDANGDCPVSRAATGLDWALDPDGDPATADAAHVASMSFGTLFHAAVLHGAVERAYQAGLLLVASAGNTHCGLVDFPAAYDEVVAVTALERTGLGGLGQRAGVALEEVRAAYASCGPEVELAAPGSWILSTVPGDGYQTSSGTSMAAPLVAGIAALAKAANPALTNVQLRCVLDATAEDLGAPGRDPEYGHGKVRADRAVALAAHPGDCAQPGAILGWLDEHP